MNALFRDKKGYGIIGYFFLVVVFVILWFIWIGGWLAEVGETAIEENALTGIEAFFYANLNVWVFMGLILGTIGFLYFFGGGE